MWVPQISALNLYRLKTLWQLIGPRGCGPNRFDLGPSMLAGEIVAEAGPRLFFRSARRVAYYWAAYYRIAADVAQFLCCFLAGTDGEVLVASLPEWALGGVTG